MDKYERLEEFKIKVMRRLSYDDRMPHEIEKIISEMFNGLKNRYKDLQCSSMSIIEYIEGNLNYAKNEINKYLNENRKDSQVEYIQAFMRNIERELDDENITTNVTRHQQEIEQMDSQDGRATERIGNILEELLTDAQSQQNRILDSRGYDMNRINEVQQETRGFINRMVNKNEDKIYEVLKQDSTKLKSWILEQYQDYIRQEEIEANKGVEKEEEKTERKEFVESLDAGISLEDQSKAAEERNTRQDEVKENQQNESALPEHVID